MDVEQWPPEGPLGGDRLANGEFYEASDEETPPSGGRSRSSGATATARVAAPSAPDAVQQPLATAPMKRKIERVESGSDEEGGRAQPGCPAKRRNVGESAPAIAGSGEGMAKEFSRFLNNVGGVDRSNAGQFWDCAQSAHAVRAGRAQPGPRGSC